MAWPAALSQKSDFSDAIAATGGIERRNGRQFLLFRSIFARLRRVLAGRLGRSRQPLMSPEPDPRPAPQQTHRPLPRQTDHHDLVSQGLARSSSEQRNALAEYAIRC
jgi:hypothetical protein